MWRLPFRFTPEAFRTGSCLRRVQPYRPRDAPLKPLSDNEFRESPPVRHSSCYMAPHREGAERQHGPRTQLANSWREKWQATTRTTRMIHNRRPRR